MTEKPMAFTRRDSGPELVLEREVKVEYTSGRPEATVTKIRVFTGPRKALRCR